MISDRNFDFLTLSAVHHPKGEDDVFAFHFGAYVTRLFAASDRPIASVDYGCVRYVNLVAVKVF
jgi:hypothetical protein